ncbi:MAG: DUF7336 domain-containing protein [Stellaceae bacterium]
MTIVYVLWHDHVDEQGCDHDMMLGIYSTEEKAKEALELLRDKPGFKGYPDGFEIARGIIDRTSMLEGFITVYPGDG